MKITSVLAALLLVSAFATQATAHTRHYRTGHRAHYRTFSMVRGIPMARSHFYNSYASGPNDPGSVSAGGEMSSNQTILRFEQMYFALQATQARMGVGLYPLFLVIDELVDKRLCVPFGSLGLRKRAYRALFRDEVKDWSAISDFCAWLTEAGRETERVTQAWAHAMGWQF